MIRPSTKQNKAIVCRFIDEAYNKRNLTVGNELLAANVVLHVSNSEIKGLAGWKQYAGSFLAGFSDIVISVKDIIAEGDKVVANWICHGIHTGELQGIVPTGKKATWTGIAIYRIVGGKIEEVWVWNDIWGMMRQLGVIPLLSLLNDNNISNEARMFKNTIGFDKICIVGTGAIGSVFGGFLSNAGYKVTFIEQNEDLIKQIKENGLSISGVKEIYLNNVVIVPPGSIIQKQDLILFAVKAYSLEEAVKSALPMIGKNTYVVCLQNGLEISEVINKYVSKEQIIEGVVWFPAAMVKPGHIELLTFYEESILGGRFQRSSEYAKKLASVLTSSGIPTKAVDNITPEIWRKAIPIIVGNSINAITGKKLGVISEIPELNESLFAMAQESLKIARAEGIELNEERLGKSMDNALEKGYEHKTSMLVDIINKRKTEVDFLNGKIIELGKKHNIQTPLNLLIYGLIKAIEKE